MAKAPLEPKGPVITLAPERGPKVRSIFPSWMPGAIRSLRPAATSIKPAPETGSAGTATTGRRPRTIALAALGFLAAATILGVRLHPWKAHTHAVRRVSGAPGPRLTSTGASEHWPVGAPIPAVLDPSLDTMDPGAKEAITVAFATWQAANLGAPTVALTSDTTPGVAAEDGVNRILFGPITVPGYEKAVAVTISYADEDGTLVEADMIVNNAYDFTIIANPGATTPAPATCGGHYDVQNVTTHEVGHFLGLGEDMSDETATMFITSLPCQTHKRTLTADDTTAMTSLYANVVPSQAAAGCGQ
jgi:Matrixin